MLRRRREAARLAEVVAPRTVESSMDAARGLFAALADERLSLEVAVSADGPRWLIRAEDEAGLGRALAQLQAAYPQAEVERIDPGRADLDPARALASEPRCGVALRHAGDDALPLRTDWRHQPDPLHGVLAAVRPAEGERVVCRLTVRPAPGGAAERIRRRVEADWRRPRSSAANTGTSILPLVAAFVLVAIGLRAWRWYEAGDWLPLLAAGGAALVGLPLVAAVAARLLAPSAELPAAVADRKLASRLAAARLEVIALGPAGTPPERLRTLALTTARAYGAYDDAAGGGLRAGRTRTGSRARARGALLLNAAELAALWHLPESGDAVQGVRRSRARRLLPPPSHAVRGCRVGIARGHSGETPVYLPRPLLLRNQLVVAKTRRGKSTLLRHLATDHMQRLLRDPGEPALVVVDPHQDLAEAVLGSVPQGLEDRVVYLDFAHRARPVGLNLLDVALFRDRDRTSEHVITMMNRLWPANWGPRMEGALRVSVATLLELNRSLPRERQHTLLDVAALLMNEPFREQVLERLDDPALLAWWRDNYSNLNRALQQQTANPVTTKIGRFMVTESSRLVFGQARSTFDPRQLLRDGGVLVVNTAAGVLGEGASALAGATLINLMGLLVEEQVDLPPQRRRRVVVLVDESSTLGAIDYGRMLSELVKYGASFVLVTQGLARLDAIDRSLAPTVFSNIDGLTVFQVSAEDARRLVPELGNGLEVEDLTGLDDFECYARWWDGAARPAAFSFRVDPPPPVRPERAAVLAARSAARYGRPREAVAAEIAGALEVQARAAAVGRERQQLSAEQVGEAAEAATAPTGKRDTPVDRPRKPGRGKAQRAAKQS